MDIIEVRDRRSGFLWINNEIIDEHAAKIGGTALLVYVYLCRFANNDTSQCHPSQEKIAAFCEVSERSVRTAIAVLIKHELIQAAQTKTAGHFAKNVYTLLSPRRKNVSYGSALSEEVSASSPEEVAVGSYSSPNKTNKQDLLNQQDLILSPPKSAEEKEPSRFSLFKELIFRFYVWKWGREPAWDGAEANQLSRLLKADPKLETNTFAVWLKNYGASKDISPGERPAMFLPRISKYSVIALNQYGRDENVGQESLAERNANAFASVFGVHFTQDRPAVLEGNEDDGHQGLARVPQRPFVTGD